MARRQRMGMKKGGGRSRGALLLAVAAFNGSCATLMPDGMSMAAADAPAGAPQELPPELVAALDVPALSGSDAIAANNLVPFADSPVASSFTLAASSDLHRLRALDCLAQAIYYEARSESEEGQRAVAQVVLNRVRHPAWPSSVCGVVYQGPMRPGGGCQFTFTCDGSLRAAPVGANWLRARRLATEALAGRVFEPVGLATFYHANYVRPAWAPRLLKVAEIGAHLFYSLPGAIGRPGAFSARYAGAEPIARPNPILVAGGRMRAGELAPWAVADRPAPAAGELPVARNDRVVAEPVTVEVDQQIRPEFRNSGQWRADAPGAITGR